MLRSASLRIKEQHRKDASILKEILRNKEKQFMKGKMETVVRIWENIALKITFIYHFSLQSCDL